MRFRLLRGGALKVVMVGFCLVAWGLEGVWGAEKRSGPGKELSVLDYPSIQAAVDANPGRRILVPAGDYTLDERVRLSTDGCGLYGSGRLIQANAKAPILQISGAKGVRVEGLTLTRAEGALETATEAVRADKCTDLTLSGLQVLNNRTLSSAIEVRECTGAAILNCLVQNYMRIAIDDRTSSADWGYAFNCINGTGIAAAYCMNTLIQGNRVIELEYLPTPAIKEKYGLGKFVKKNATKGLITNPKTWEMEYTNAWHQGSAIIVNAPEVSDYSRVIGNSIENAAQGIDIHSDHIVVANNIVNNAFMGMKAMHGSRNVIITGNQFSKNDLWSIGLMPGAASHAPIPAQDGKPERPANVDGGSIIANNIISDFGYGHAHWMWAGEGTPMRFDNGQKPENPPLKDVIVQGNVIYDPGGDGVVVDGKVQKAPPRYRYAVRISAEVKGLVFSGNVFHPGVEGISNVEIKP